MTSIETAKLVAVLLQAYPAAQFGPASSAAYERHLADLELRAASEALDRLIRTSKFLPTIAEIRSMAADIAHGPRRLGAEAWGDVGEAVRRVGSYCPAPEFADPLCGEAVRLFGWLNICRGTNEAADRARFIELYEGLAERERANVIAARALPRPAGGYLRLREGAPNVAALAAGIGRRVP